MSAPGLTPLDPAFSRDGRWLAFLGMSANPSVTSYALWITSGDGHGAREIHGLAVGELIGWSPVADVLAVTAGPLPARVPYGAPATVRLVSPSGSARTLMSAVGIESAAWSPDGGSIAVATRQWPSATTLASYLVAGGKPTVWLRLNARSGVLNGMNEIIIDPAGWWPRWGIGFWVFGDGMVHNNDQTPLDVIAAPGARPRPLGDTLSGNSAPVAAVAPDGWLAIVNNPDLRNLGRIIWQDKRVETCSPADGRCAAVSSPPSTVTLDPAWSPDGSHLAYVQAPCRASPGFPQNVTMAWYSAHQLWLYNPASRSISKLSASGASVPVWSADGKSLLYVARDAVLAAAAALRPAGPDRGAAVPTRQLAGLLRAGQLDQPVRVVARSWPVMTGSQKARRRAALALRPDWREGLGNLSGKVSAKLSLNPPPEFGSGMAWQTRRCP